MDRTATRTRKLGAALSLTLALAAMVAWSAATPASGAGAEDRTLDGAGNNVANPDWGRAGTQYLRVGSANYADGISEMVAGPATRFVSNRVFNDLGRNLFSENRISQWGWSWGQFMDHDFGLRDETPAEHAPIAFDDGDPLERFTNDFGAIDFSRTPAAPGTGTSSPREHINTISSYIDGSGIFGVTDERLDWLRDGSVDGDSSNNDADLLLPDGYLPRRDERGDAGSAPEMALFGGQVATPGSAVVAGDVRANENIALTALHTLFAREHNRIVASLPNTLSEQQKFQVARRVVGATQQFITFEEFLPALGVALPDYGGYDPGVNPGLGNEFAVVGYRAHSMIHGEFEVAAAAGSYTGAQLNDFRDMGITVVQRGGQVELTIPLTVAFGNPDLLQQVGLGPMLQGLGGERQYKNDEQIDESLRSLLFQVPGATGVVDLGAIDVERGRDHGMPSYNDLRVAYGLDPADNFTEITGEATQNFLPDPQINPADPINDPDILDFLQILDEDGTPAAPGSDEAVTGIRRSTLAARLRAIHGDVDDVDAFTGMVSEPHVAGTEFGELQLAIWRQQFEALRDGDRFFYANDPELEAIEDAYGVSYRQTLAQVIERNASVDVEPNVFQLAAEGAAPAPATPEETTPATSSGSDDDSKCASVRKKLKKAKSKKAKRKLRRKLRTLSC